MLDIRIEKAEGGEQARGGRHDHALDAERLCHAAAEERPVAAEGEEREGARIAAALGRHGLDGADHVRGGDEMSAVGGFFHGQFHFF